MVKALWTQKFERDFKHVKDIITRERVLKQIKKIAEKLDTGKQLRYSLKGERTINIKPYR